MIGVALAAALLATGIWLGPDLASFWKSATAAPRFSSRPTVAVVGDSITALSRQSIATSLAQAGYQPGSDNGNSKRVPPMSRPLRPMLRSSGVAAERRRSREREGVPKVH